MNFQLKERREEVLSNVSITDTFKIPESSFIFMKMDVDGLTVQAIKRADEEVDPKPIKVLIPEGKAAVICLSTGKAQFLNLNEKIQLVNLQCVETLEE